MNTTIIVTLIVAALIAFLAILGYVSGKQEREIRKIEATKEMPKALFDYMFGGKNNDESKNDSD